MGLFKQCDTGYIGRNNQFLEKKLAQHDLVSIRKILLDN